jgi:hypothetical protein
VSSERRDRFLKLERPRPDGEESDPLPDERRFERLGEAPGGPGGAAPVPSSSTDRFRPPPPRPLETAEGAADAQPFTRCAGCETDNTRYAETCQSCGARLDTPAQRAFNEKLWAARQAEATAERRALAERESARQGQAAEEARMRREVAEEMARRERDRVDAELPDGPLGRGPVEGPAGTRDTAGMRLLRMLPGARWRIAAAVLGIGLPLLLVLFGRGQVQVAGMMLLGIVFALFSPARRRMRRW